VVKAHGGGVGRGGANGSAVEQVQAGRAYCTREQSVVPFYRWLPAPERCPDVPRVVLTAVGGLPGGQREQRGYCAIGGAARGGHRTRAALMRAWPRGVRPREGASLRKACSLGKCVGRAQTPRAGAARATSWRGSVPVRPFQLRLL
jgi:hypothetical protein